MLRERGKPPVAYMVDADRNSVGGAFVSALNRDMRERLWQRVTSKAGPPAKGLTMKPGAEWVRPGLRATVRHLKGEEMLRHASLKATSRTEAQIREELVKAFRHFGAKSDLLSIVGSWGDTMDKSGR